MSQRQHKKTKIKHSPSPIANSLTGQIKQLINNCNIFLKNNFHISEKRMDKYAQCVKQFFIRQSTNTEYSCLLGSLLSKISNILQPFIGIKQKSNHKDIQFGQISLALSLQREKNEKMKVKLGRVYEQLQQYQVKSSKLTNFIYLLRKNNIDVDSIYEKGCQEQPQKTYNQMRSYEISHRKHEMVEKQINIEEEIQQRQQSDRNNSERSSDDFSCYTLKNFETN